MSDDARIAEIRARHHKVKDIIPSRSNDWREIDACASGEGYWPCHTAYLLERLDATEARLAAAEAALRGILMSDGHLRDCWRTQRCSPECAVVRAALAGQPADGGQG